MPIGNDRILTVALLAYARMRLLLAIVSRVLQYSWKAGSARIRIMVSRMWPVAYRAASRSLIC
jgi:phosphoglycerate-specific signal transduction histidine kinase